jgi:hypothetical protein
LCRHWLYLAYPDRITGKIFHPLGGELPAFNPQLSWSHYRALMRVIDAMLPTPGNAAAFDAFGKNIFSVTWQVRYSNDSGNELDFVIFINGLPVLAFELKNSLTRQAVAVLQAA